MSTKEAYQEKIETEVKLALVSLAELKARARTSTADARIKYSKQVDTLEREVVTMRSKIKEMTAAGEDFWEQLKNGAEHGWSEPNTAVQDAIAQIQGMKDNIKESI
jgi:uncharacterized protein YgiM (DUF1202 family)